MKNNVGCHTAGAHSIQECPAAMQKEERETAVSQKSANFALHMSKQLTEAQRYEIYLGSSENTYPKNPILTASQINTS